MSLAKLLFVDDETAFVEAMIKRLNIRDIEVTPAHSGPEALEQLADKADLEVVILDIRMPGMDGIEMAAERSLGSRGRLLHDQPIAAPFLCQ